MKPHLVFKFYINNRWMVLVLSPCLYRLLHEGSTQSSWSLLASQGLKAPVKLFWSKQRKNKCKLPLCQNYFICVNNINQPLKDEWSTFWDPLGISLYTRPALETRRMWHRATKSRAPHQMKQFAMLRVVPRPITWKRKTIPFIPFYFVVVKVNAGHGLVHLKPSFSI